MTYRIQRYIMQWIFVIMFIVGVVTATFNLTFGGFTPVIWFLIGALAILLVICSEVTQLREHFTEKK